VVSFQPWPLYPRRKSPPNTLERRLGRPQSRSGRGPCPYREQNPSRPGRSSVTVPTELSRPSENINWDIFVFRRLSFMITSFRSRSEKKEIYEVPVLLCVSALQLLDQLADFHEIWYELHATGGRRKETNWIQIWTGNSDIMNSYTKSLHRFSNTQLEINSRHCKIQACLRLF
jgi:hypothetical protein